MKVLSLPAQHNEGGSLEITVQTNFEVTEAIQIDLECQSPQLSQFSKSSNDSLNTADSENSLPTEI